MKSHIKKEAWIVAADMGYGHQRAAYPLKDIAFERVINANSDKIVSNDERKIWKKARFFYEWISRMTEIPIIGKTLFGLFNKIQEISPYYPLRNSPTPTFEVRYLNKKIKKGFGKSLISYVQKKNIPFVTTFYIPAMAANYFKLENAYCVICDFDINRIWAPLNSKDASIKYFVPCQHTLNRMISYGVPSEKLFLTGFPLPKENIGGVNSPITKKVLAQRLINLDPQKKFLSANKYSIQKELGKKFNIKKKSMSITITFVIGGAGAQKEIATDILMSLKEKLLKGDVNLCLVAGTHLEVKEHFLEVILSEGLKSVLNKNLTIIFELTKKDYFKSFNAQLNKTDVLWTKPSELSFYSGLAIPIIIAPPIGAQELWNRKWLFEIGAGSNQEDPKYTHLWLFEKLKDGRLARKAWNAYLNAPRLGTYNIERILFEK